MLTTILTIAGGILAALATAFAGGRYSGKRAERRARDSARAKAMRHQREIEQDVDRLPIRDVHHELDGWGP